MLHDVCHYLKRRVFSHRLDCSMTGVTDVSYPNLFVTSSPLSQTTSQFCPGCVSCNCHCEAHLLHPSVVRSVPDMTYNVFGGTLSLTQSINQSWSGLCSANDHLQLHAFLRRCRQYRYCADDVASISDLFAAADQSLCSSVS